MYVFISDQQRRALDEQAGEPLEVVDPQTRQAYILIARDRYDALQMPAEAAGQRAQRCGTIVAQIPPQIRCSQEAYWRELPDLLSLASSRRRWVAFHGDERIGFGRTETELYQECYRRGLKDDEIYVGRLRPSLVPPWEAEVIEPSLYESAADDDNPA